MNKKTRNALILAAVAVILIAAAVLCMNTLSPDTQTGDKTITIFINHSDGTKKELTLSTNGAYLWDALEPTGFFAGEEGNYGLMIDTVDGEFADSTKGIYWMFTKDGDYVAYGVSEAPISDGECYEFHTEQY